MLSRFIILLRHDLRLESAYGILAAYAFVIISYLVILLVFRDIIPNWLIAVIIYTDPTVLGFFFLGGLMMLEKSENTREALTITPVSALEYILSKFTSLTLVALCAVALLGYIANAQNLLLLLVSVIPASLFFVCLGILVARKMKTVTGYLIGSIPVITPIVLPMFLPFTAYYATWMNIIPSTGQFWLMLVALGTVSATVTEIALTLVAISLFSGLLLWLANRSLQQEFGQK